MTARKPQTDRIGDEPLPVPHITQLGALPLVRAFVTERVETAPEYAEFLAAAGLDGFASVWQVPYKRAVTGHRDRHVVIVETGVVPDTRRFFLKRLGRAHLKHLLEALFERRWPVSKCRREWEFARKLSHVGVGTPPFAAMGERRCGPWPLESYLITEEMYGALPLDEYLAELETLPEREGTALVRKLGRSLAEILATMHGAGIFHRDLYAKHIFVRRDGGDFVINIIDLQRMLEKRGSRYAAKDLAGLHATVPLRLAGPKTRMRFLRDYARATGEEGPEHLRRFADAVRRRSARISKRSKFRALERLPEGKP